MKKTTCVFILILMVILALCGCGKDAKPGDKSRENIDEENRKEKINEPADLLHEKESTKKESEVDKILGEMTLEEKVGQVFIISFRYNSLNEPMVVLDENASKTIRDYALGGVILFSENIDTIPQTQKLIKDMQSSSSIPLFIGVDEEGGLVSRLNSSGKMHATKLPGNMALGKTQDLRLAYEVGTLLGRETGSLGFNINFAPVADVNTNPENPVIGKRSFGTEPEKVAEMVGAVVKGIQDQNVSAVLKHFPGHGDTSMDTHTGAVVIKHDRDRLERIEFVPFRKGMEAGVDGIMTAHIQVQEITGSDLPATLSREILTDILRSDMGYEGLIITDALEMGAISKYWNSGEAAVKAFKAGADILLMPAYFKEAYDVLLGAVKKGEISEQRLDESVRRILKIKQRRKILETKMENTDPEKILGSSEHKAIADRIKEKVTKK